MNDNILELNACIIEFQLNLSKLSDKLSYLFEQVIKKNQQDEKKALESIDGAKEAEDSLIVANIKEAKPEPQINIQEECKKQLSEYLYVESFTDMSWRNKTF